MIKLEKALQIILDSRNEDITPTLINYLLCNKVQSRINSVIKYILQSRQSFGTLTKEMLRHCCSYLSIADSVRCISVCWHWARVMQWIRDVGTKNGIQFPSGFSSVSLELVEDNSHVDHEYYTRYMFIKKRTNQLIIPRGLSTQALKFFLPVIDRHDSKLLEKKAPCFKSDDNEDDDDEDEDQAYCSSCASCFSACYDDWDETEYRSMPWLTATSITDFRCTVENQKISIVMHKDKSKNVTCMIPRSITKCNRILTLAISPDKPDDNDNDDDGDGDYLAAALFCQDDIQEAFDPDISILDQIRERENRQTEIVIWNSKTNQHTRWRTGVIFDSVRMNEKQCQIAINSWFVAIRFIHDEHKIYLFTHQGKLWKICHGRPSQFLLCNQGFIFLSPEEEAFILPFCFDVSLPVESSSFKRKRK